MAERATLTLLAPYRASKELVDMTERVGRLPPEEAAIETWLAYDQAYEASLISPTVENFRAAVAAYDLMVVFNPEMRGRA